LGKIGDAEAVPHLLLLLYDRSVAIRLSAVHALERLADPRAVPYLELLSEKDSDEIVRNVAKSALKNFHNKISSYNVTAK
jgi:HEAT repeat protein